MNNRKISFICLLASLLSLSSCGNDEDSNSLIGHGELIPITVNIEGITEDIAQVRNVVKSETITQVLNDGNILEVTLEPTNKISTRAVSKPVDANAQILIIAYRSSDKSPYKMGYFTSASPYITLPAGETMDLVFYSHNTTAAKPTLEYEEGGVDENGLFTSGTILKDISVSHKEMIRAELLNTSITENMKLSPIKFKHIFSKAKLNIISTEVDKKITECIASTSTAFDHADVNAQIGVFTADREIIIPLEFPMLNLQTISSNYINLIPDITKNFAVDLESLTFGGVNHTNKTFIFNQPVHSGVSYTINARLNPKYEILFTSDLGGKVETDRVEAPGGSTASSTAIPNDGYEFEGWYSDNIKIMSTSATNAEYVNGATLYVKASLETQKTYTARFTLVGYLVGGLRWAPSNIVSTDKGVTYFFASSQDYFSGLRNGGDYFNWNTLDPTDRISHNTSWLDQRDPCRRVDLSGRQWRTPTIADLSTLLGKVKWGQYATGKDGTSGKYGLFVSPTVPTTDVEKRNTLFFTAAGYLPKDNGAPENQNMAGSYMSSELAPSVSGVTGIFTNMYMTESNGGTCILDPVSVDGGITIRCVTNQ